MPQQHLTAGKDPVPIVQEAGWASGPVWIGVENLALPGFDPQTVQPVGSRYTDYATRPTNLIVPYINIITHTLIYIYVCVCVSPVTRRVLAGDYTNMEKLG